jgi:hypothetical protein
MVAVVATVVNDAVYEPPVVRLVQLTPASVLICHWYIVAGGILPTVATVKFAVCPTHTVLFCGCVLITGAVATFNTTGLEVTAGGHTPVTTQV